MNKTISKNNITDRNHHYKVIFSKKQNTMFLDFWKSLSKKQQNTVLIDYDSDINKDCYIFDILSNLGYKINKKYGFLNDYDDSDVYLAYMCGLASIIDIRVFNNDLDIELDREQKQFVANECNYDIDVVLVD
jgi:hypothetical protein